MPLEEFYLTIPTPSAEEVEKWVYSNAPQPVGPTWAVVCVMLGALLSVGAGAFLITLGLTS